MDFETVELAFHFVSGGPMGEHHAVISRSTGEVYYASVMAGIDEMPEDVDDNDDYVSIPHKNDLNLGQRLVTDFIRLRSPQDLDYVRAIFSRRGAYQRYKSFLVDKNLLEQWHAFENNRTKEALMEWCEEVGLVIEE